MNVVLSPEPRMSLPKQSYEFMLVPIYITVIRSLNGDNITVDQKRKSRNNWKTKEGGKTGASNKKSTKYCITEGKVRLSDNYKYGVT